jgi:hypothetical protein
MSCGLVGGVEALQMITRDYRAIAGHLGRIRLNCPFRFSEPRGCPPGITRRLRSQGFPGSAEADVYDARIRGQQRHDRLPVR